MKFHNTSSVRKKWQADNTSDLNKWLQQSTIAITIVVCWWMCGIIFVFLLKMRKQKFGEKQRKKNFCRKKCLRKCVSLRWQAFPVRNYAALPNGTMNDKLWTNVSKYDDDDDWLLFSLSPFPLDACARVSLSYDKSSCVKKYSFYLFCLWHFNKLNPPMHDIFDTFWYTSAHILYYGMQSSLSFLYIYITIREILIPFCVSKQNSQQHKRNVCFHFCSFVIHIYTSHIAQCNPIFLCE